jgi:DNA-binding transcriptional LysR family regulator
MELRHLRYFVAVGEEQHYGRAARRLRVAQPALSRQIQDLERELGFDLFERLPRGVRLSAAGTLFLADARRILQDVSDAAARAARVARGQSGTLRVGFTESQSWRGVVPDSFRQFRQMRPDAELQLHPAPSVDQLDAIRAGRLDAGFVFNVPKPDPDVEQLPVAAHHIELAAPRGHPLTKLRDIRLRHLVDVPFVSFPRWAAPALYDNLSQACRRGGLKSPNVVQEGLDEATILSLVATGLGVGWVFGTSRWRCPKSVVILTVVDLNVPQLLSLAWRKDNRSPLLASFVAHVSLNAEARPVKNGLAHPVAARRRSDPIDASDAGRKKTSSPRKRR